MERPKAPTKEEIEAELVSERVNAATVRMSLVLHQSLTEPSEMLHALALATGSVVANYFEVEDADGVLEASGSIVRDAMARTLAGMAEAGVVPAVALKRRSH